MDQVAIVLTLPELWLVQGVVRHAVADAKAWQGDEPVSKDLNHQVGDAIRLCSVHSFEDYPLTVTAHQLDVLDYCVSQTAKSADGLPLGKQILMKVFVARDALAYEAPETVEPTPVHTFAEYQAERHTRFPGE